MCILVHLMISHRSLGTLFFFFFHSFFFLFLRLCNLNWPVFNCIDSSAKSNLLQSLVNWIFLFSCIFVLLSFRTSISIWYVCMYVSHNYFVVENDISFFGCTMWLAGFFFLIIFIFLACRILVPRPGIEPVPSALGVPSFNHLTTREVPACGILTLQPEIEPRPSAVKARSPNHWIVREFPMMTS